MEKQVISSKIHHIRALLFLFFCGWIALFISTTLQQLIYLRAAKLIIPIVIFVISALELSPDASKYIFSQKAKDIFLVYILILIVFLIFSFLMDNDFFGIREYSISIAVSISSFIGIKETSTCIFAVTASGRIFSEYWCTQYFLSWFLGGLLFLLPSLALANKIVSRLQSKNLRFFFSIATTAYVISLVFIARYVFALDARHLLPPTRPILETIGQTVFVLTMMGLFTLLTLIGTLLLCLTMLTTFKYLRITSPKNYPPPPTIGVWGPVPNAVRAARPSGEDKRRQ